MAEEEYGFIVRVCRPDNRWFWSIYVMGKARGHVTTDGRAASFEDAKRQFRKSWEKFQAWPRL